MMAHQDHGARGNEAYRSGQLDKAVGDYTRAVRVALEQAAAPEVVAKYYGNRAQVKSLIQFTC